MSRALALSVALALAACGTIAGCGTIAPWERGALAHPAMRQVTEGERASFDAHIAGARESALDPGAAGGGGCGCN